MERRRYTTGFGNGLFRTENHMFARHNRVALMAALLAALACPVSVSKALAANTGQMQAALAPTEEASNGIPPVQVAPPEPATEGGMKPSAAAGTPSKAATRGAMRRPSPATGKPPAARDPRATNHKAGWSDYAARSDAGTGLILGVRY